MFSVSHRLTNTIVPSKYSLSKSFVRRLLAPIAFLACTMSTGSEAYSGPTFVMDAFCIRQFNNPSYLGTQVNYDVQAFEDKINEYFATGQYPLVDGYAPFWYDRRDVFFPSNCLQHIFR